MPAGQREEEGLRGHEFLGGGGAPPPGGPPRHTHGGAQGAKLVGKKAAPHTREQPGHAGPYSHPPARSHRIKLAGAHGATTGKHATLTRDETNHAGPHTPTPTLSRRMKLAGALAPATICCRERERNRLYCETESIPGVLGAVR